MRVCIRCSCSHRWMTGLAMNSNATRFHNRYTLPRYSILTCCPEVQKIYLYPCRSLFLLSTLWGDSQEIVVVLCHMPENTGASMCFVGLVWLIADMIGITTLTSTIFISETQMLWLAWGRSPHYMSIFTITSVQVNFSVHNSSNGCISRTKWKGK